MLRQNFEGPWKNRRDARATLALALKLANDARAQETSRERQKFKSVRNAEMRYARNLRSVARQVGDIVREFGADDPIEAAGRIADHLRAYGKWLEPWAKVTAERMLGDVSRRDSAVWNEIAKDMSRSLRQEIAAAPTGELLRGLLEEQVSLITSLPLEAAQRVQGLALEALSNAKRPDEVAKEILRSRHVTVSRANLIARTEVARASSGLVEARAVYVGSEGYVWETSREADVRPSHRKMQGRFVKWSDPPVLDNLTGHAGQLPNCRCWPRPIFPEER